MTQELDNWELESNEDGGSALRDFGCFSRIVGSGGDSRCELLIGPRVKRGFVLWRFLDRTAIYPVNEVADTGVLFRSQKCCRIRELCLYAIKVFCQVEKSFG